MRVAFEQFTKSERAEREKDPMMTKQEFLHKMANRDLLLPRRALLIIWDTVDGVNDSSVRSGRAGQFSSQDGCIYTNSGVIIDPHGLKDDAMIEWTNERLFSELTTVIRGTETVLDELNW